MSSNTDFTRITGIFEALSLYSPIILVSGMLMYSILSNTMAKFGFYMAWLICVITTFRMFAYKFFNQTSDDNVNNINPICLSGLTTAFVPYDVLYSTYILTYTLFYFLTPMIIISGNSNGDSINYFIVIFFICYIVFDLLMKHTIGCSSNISNVGISANILFGSLLGIGCSTFMYYIGNLQKYLYINETTGNNEVCSMPSKQQFKCRVYKNGELIGSSVQ